MAAELSEWQAVKMNRPLGPPKYSHHSHSVYRLCPLSHAYNIIRLLRPLPSHDHTDLVYDLDVWTIKDAPPYVAVSYTWGSNSPTRHLLVRNHWIEVRENCYNALQQVREHFPNDYVWIDSICIDQGNPREKSMQVSRMAHIYEHAKLVTACMGLEAWDGTIASQLQQSWWSDSAQINAMSAHQVQSGLIALLEKKYWSRLWICQELYFARKIYILYGTTALQWAEFYEAYESSDIKLTTYCHMLLHMVNERQLRDSQPHVPSRSSRMASRFFRHRTAVKAPQPTLEELLEFTQEAECADPRDRIYGILKLCEETETITVDYAEDEANLMIRLMKSWHSTRSIVDQLQLLARTLRIDQGTQQSILQAPIRQPSIDTRNEGFRRLSVEWDTRLALTRQSLSGVPKLYSIIDQAPEGHLCAETLLPSTSSTDEIAKFFTTQNSSLTALLTGESAQKLVFSFGLPVAVLCSTARKGDHIVSFGDLMLPPVDASWPSRPVLVLRKDESGRQNEFGLRVIGQGIVLPWAISSARQERDRRTLHIRDVGNELIVGMARFELLDCPTNIDNWMTFNQIPLYNYYEKYRAVGLENIPPERHAQGLASLHSESQGNA